MTTTTIKHQEDIRVIKTPNQRMQETNIKQGMVFKAVRQNEHASDETFVIVIAQVCASAYNLQAINISSWNMFNDGKYSPLVTVAKVMQSDKHNYVYFEIMDSIEVIIK